MQTLFSVGSVIKTLLLSMTSLILSSFVPVSEKDNGLFVLLVCIHRRFSRRFGTINVKAEAEAASTRGY